MKIKCPVCGKTVLEEWFDTCEECGWQYDNIQYIKPDLTGCGNKMSLNEARETYRKGERIL